MRKISKKKLKIVYDLMEKFREGHHPEYKLKKEYYLELGKLRYKRTKINREIKALKEKYEKEKVFIKL